MSANSWGDWAASTYLGRSWRHPERMWLKSEVPAAAGAVGLTVEVAEDIGYRGWDCSPAGGAAGTVLGEGSSTRALACLHGSGLLLGAVGGQAGGCGSPDSTSAGAAGEGEGRRTWRTGGRSCAGAGPDSRRLRYARDFGGCGSVQHLPATAASTGECRSEG